MKQPRFKSIETPELKGLLLCSRRNLSGPDKEAFAELIKNPFDWQRFIRLAREHRLFPSVHETLKKHFGPEIPEDVLQAFESMHKRHIHKCMTNMAAAFRISDLLNENGIDHLFLKGFALSQILYGSPCARYAGDIDLIVHDTQFHKTTRILEDKGYQQTYSGTELTEANRNSFLENVHHLSYRCPATGASIELHYRFIDIPECFPFDFAQAWHQKRIVTVQGVRLPVMGLRHTLIHLTFHGSKHFWKRLFWLKDIVDYFDGCLKLDQQAFFEDMISLNLLRPAAEMLLLKTLFSGSDCPEYVLRNTTQDWFLRSVPVMTDLHLKNPDGALALVLFYFHSVFMHKNIRYSRLTVKKILLAKYSVKTYNPGNRSKFLKAISHRIR